MASLQPVRVNRRTYWRIVESRRVNGKPRPIPVLHLGTADALLDRLLRAPGGRIRLRSFQHGDVAALKAVADRLDVVSIIDRHVRRSAHGLSVGTTLLLAALNRASRPRSKRGWAPWAQETSLSRLFPGLQPETLTSQYFWDQMDCVELPALASIEEDLTRKVIAELGIKLDALFYDTTNFFTYIAATNSRPKLAQRGHSKQKRTDLRLFGLALLVSRDGQIPLYSQVYEGNRVDSKVFPDALSRIRERMGRLSLELKDITLVYDKGNNSQKNLAAVDQAEIGYVASLVPVHFRDLLALPLSQYRPLQEGRLAGTQVHRLTREIWGRKRTVLLTVSEQLRSGQIRGLEQHLQKRLRELNAWQETLKKPRSGPHSPESAQKRIDGLLAGQYLREVLRIEFDPARAGGDRLRFWIDAQARAHLEREIFGKRILITNREAWSDEEIILAYRGQSNVEHAFRQVKDDEHLTLRPQYHWTDQKIHVHAFLCLLAFLLGRVMEREARKLGQTEGLSGLLDLLGRVRLAMILRPAGKKGGRPRCEWQIEDGDPAALQLFRNLVPPQPPFVYTDGKSEKPCK